MLLCTAEPVLLQLAVSNAADSGLLKEICTFNSSKAEKGSSKGSRRAKRQDRTIPPIPPNADADGTKPLYAVVWISETSARKGGYSALSLSLPRWYCS